MALYNPAGCQSGEGLSSSYRERETQKKQQNKRLEHNSDASALKQPSENRLCLCFPTLLFLHLLFSRVHVRLKVHFVQGHKLGPLEYFPAQIHDQHDGQFDVEADEANAVKRWAEAAPALHQDQERVEDDGEPGAIRVRPVLKGQQMRLALAGDGGAEAERSDANGNPAELVTNPDNATRDQVSDTALGNVRGDHVLLQPRPELTGTDEAGAETESRDKTGDQDSHPRHLVTVEGAEESRRVALHGQGVQQPCSGEQRMVAGRQDASQNDGIDDTARGLCSGHLEDDGERRGACVLGVEVGIVVGHVETDEKNGKDT